MINLILVWALIIELGIVLAVLITMLLINKRDVNKFSKDLIYVKTMTNEQENVLAVLTTTL